MGSSVILPLRGQPKQGPDSTFKSAAIPNVVSFGFQGIDPPASLYIQRDDVLVLECFTQNAPEAVTIFARLLTPLAPQPGQPDHGPPAPADPRGYIGPGYIQLVQQVVQVPNARALVSLAIPLMEGYLLSVSATGLNSNRRGQTFARVFINRGSFNPFAPNVAAALFADYVTSTAPAGWPGGRVVSAVEGPGLFQSYTPANPGAGADLTFTSNTSGRVRLASFSTLFTASAAAANRIVSFQFAPTGGAGTQYVVQDTVVVTASQVLRYSLGSGTSNVRGAGLGTAGNPIDVVLPLPSPAIGVSAINVQSATQNIQAGDQYSSILVSTEEWFDLI